MTPTLTMFAAPRGGASLLRAAERRLWVAPRLTAFAAPRGGISLLRAAERRLK